MLKRSHSEMKKSDESDIEDSSGRKIQIVRAVGEPSGGVAFYKHRFDDLHIGIMPSSAGSENKNRIPQQCLVPIEPFTGVGFKEGLLRRAATALEPIMALPVDTLSPAPWRQFETIFDTIRSAFEEPQQEEEAQTFFSPDELRINQFNQCKYRSGSYLRFQKDYVYLEAEEEQFLQSQRNPKFAVKGVVTEFDWTHQAVLYDKEIKNIDWTGTDFFPEAGYLGCLCSLSRCVGPACSIAYPSLAFLSSYLKDKSAQTHVSHSCGFVMHHMCAYNFFINNLVNSALFKEQPYIDMYSPDRSINAMEYCAGCGNRLAEEEIKRMMATFLTYYSGLQILPDIELGVSLSMGSKVRFEHARLGTECPTVLSDMRAQFQSRLTFKSLFRNISRPIVRKMLSPSILQELKAKCDAQGEATVTPSDLMCFMVEAFEAVDSYSMFSEVFTALRGDFRTVHRELDEQQ